MFPDRYIWHDGETDGSVLSVDDTKFLLWLLKPLLGGDVFLFQSRHLIHGGIYLSLKMAGPLLGVTCPGLHMTPVDTPYRVVGECDEIPARKK